MTRRQPRGEATFEEERRMVVEEQDVVSRTMEFWRSKGFTLSQEDARAATENICAFVETLAKWNKAGE
jgi:hypothetical protein